MTSKSGGCDGNDSATIATAVATAVATAATAATATARTNTGILRSAQNDGLHQ
jgi:hypothetical protein